MYVTATKVKLMDSKYTKLSEYGENIFSVIKKTFKVGVSH